MVVKNNISWRAPVLPSVSLAGIPLGINVSDLDCLLYRYLIDREIDLYKFDDAPVLKLRVTEYESETLYLFRIYDVELTNWRLFFSSPEHAGVNTRALAIIVRNRIVHAVKVWNFELGNEGDKPKNVYAGKLPEGIGLDDPISSLLPYTSLQYDEAEEWFYTDESYGGLEVTGCGNLDEYPDQVIRALTVIAKSPVQMSRSNVQ